MKKHKKRIILLTVIVLLGAGGFLVNKYLLVEGLQGKKPAATGQKGDENKNDRKGGAKIVPVKVYIADYEYIDEGISVIGTLLANEEVDIASETSGKVDKILFEEGSMVKRGALLVKVDDRDLQAQLERADYQASLLKDKVDRNRVLFSKDAISREAFDQVETDYNMVMSDIQLLRVRIDKTEIRAPFDGMIGFRHISLGSYLQPNTLVARLVDVSKLKVEFAIPEKYYRTVTKGSQVSFTVAGNPRSCHARVYAIDPTVDVLTRTMTVRALYDNRDMGMLPGMSASLRVGQKSGSQIQIPTEAIVPEQEGMKVWVVREGKAHSTRITSGLRNESMITVRNGLVRGDSVVITGVLQLKEGATVQVVE
ncbi:MexH family multidrug efflux RND transporter periplasmic adaptor subunit [Bacteroidia bacterium]|nr:MexH family multidrug efflux RND transporter periplasmic adaptor subunit [Bacteroidia bacterium]